MKKNITKYLLLATIASLFTQPTYTSDATLDLSVNALKTNLQNNPLRHSASLFFGDVAGLLLGLAAANLGDEAGKAIVKKVGLSGNSSALKRIAAIATYMTTNWAMTIPLCLADMVLVVNLADSGMAISAPTFTAALISAGRSFNIMLPIAAAFKCVRYIQNPDIQPQPAATAA